MNMKRGMNEMKRNLLSFTIFLLSTFCLFVSVNLFWNLGIYVDEYNTSPDVVLGGDMWLTMEWLKLLFLFLIVMLSGISLFRKG